MIDISQTSPSEPWLELCLEQPDKESTDIRVEDLLHSLNALKNMIYLLAASHATSETPMRPLPANSVVRRDFESTFDLVCKQTRPGSYVVPLSIRTKRVPDEYIEHTEASERFGLDLTLAIEKTIQVISTGDQTKINDHLPEPSNRKRILEAISALSPSAKIKAVLRKPSKDEPLWLYNSGECQKNVKQMIKTAMLETRQLQSKESTVIAEIEKIDAKAKLFRARTEDGLVIDGRLDREFPDGQCLLPPKYIEIDGTFEIDGDDIERSVITQTEKRLIDDSDISIREFSVGSELLIADPPFKYTVEFFGDESVYTLDGDLDLHLYGYSRKHLEEALGLALTLLGKITY